MSNIPYKNFTILDLSGVQQPYVNSTTEVGYFSGTRVGPILQNTWRSLPAVLNTNNGIATVDASGVRILNPGMYKINLSLFPTSTQDVSSNISFNFGTTHLSGVSTNVPVNSFGGIRPTGMFTFDLSNNPFTPGIISWVANGYSSGNSGSNFVKTQTNELSYNYSTAGTGGQIFSGICTTEIRFFINAPITIYFNVSGNSTTVNMSNCIFTLQLISSYSFPFIWRARNTSIINPAPTSANWRSIASSSNGQYLAAVAHQPDTDGYIYTSTNYGVSWSQSTTSKKWLSIASSSDGSRLVAGTSGQGIYTNANSGSGTWTVTLAIDKTAKWISIASDSTGKYLAAVSNDGYGLWTNANFGIGTWDERTAGQKFLNGLPPAGSTNWSSIASDSTGQYLAAVVDNGTIYTNTNYGNDTWSARTNGLPATAKWYSIASSSDGSKLAAVAYDGGIYTSTNYGGTWSLQTLGLPTTAIWRYIASSSSGQYLAAVASDSKGGIYTSSNSGASWTRQTALLPSGSLPPTAIWSSITSSSDGTRLAAVINGGTIYTGESI